MTAMFENAGLRNISVRRIHDFQKDDQGESWTFWTLLMAVGQKVRESMIVESNL
jgi:hypothetical protein